LTPAPAPGPSEASPERVFNDKRVKFVTLKAYEKAGGTTRRDLFSDDDTGVYIEDSGLLDTLVTERLDKNAHAVRAEGWKWVLLTPDFAYQQRARAETF
jgi:ParB family chromosome partitioning protein